MTHARRWMRLLAAAFALAAPGCGDDGATPDYTGHEDLVPPNVKYDEPDPYQRGKERLSVDVFYEGGRSETIKVNGFRNHFYIFGFNEFGRDAFTLVPAGDRMEGEQSDLIILAGTDFWGGGIVWDEPIDLSGWQFLFVALKSADPSFARIELTLISGEGDEERAAALDPRNYGYVNDGEWHFLRIPLADAVARGWDPRRAHSPFIIGGAGNRAGDRLYVDNLYLTRY